LQDAPPITPASSLTQPAAPGVAGLGRAIPVYWREGRMPLVCLLLNPIFVDILYRLVAASGSRPFRLTAHSSERKRHLMRFVNLLVAGLLGVGTLLCHSAWAMPGEELGRVHVKPLHSHATPDHGHAGGESAADPCALTTALQALGFNVTAPPVAVVDELPTLDAIAAIGSRAPLPPVSNPVLPTTPVHQRVVLVI
jgi:hypothetical protein